MKTMRFFMVALMCMMVSSVCLADDRIVPVNQLPANAKLFIQEHFPEASISYAVLDREFKGKRYDVKLNNNMEIEFDKKGNWTKVNCKGYPVPAALIPPMISEYVKANFPDTDVTKIDKERNRWEIKLSNGLDLKFNKSFKCIGMDD